MGNMWRLPGAERGGESERGSAANIPVLPAAPPQPPPHHGPLPTAAAGLPPALTPRFAERGGCGCCPPRGQGGQGGAGVPAVQGGSDGVRAESRRRECPRCHGTRGPPGGPRAGAGHRGRGVRAAGCAQRHRALHTGDERGR